jgi:alpha-tubulin suppressor-like RCC1 family protein
VPVSIPPEVTQVSAHGWQAIALTADGRVWTWGSDAFGQIGNGQSTRGRETKGLVWPTPAPVAGIERAAYVESGGPDDVAVLANGEVYGWGGNFGGELSVPAGERTRPVKIADLSGKGVVSVVTGGFLTSGGDIYALTASGTVLAQGRNELGELGGAGGAVPLPPVKEVAASLESAYALTTDGSLYAWGADPGGQLGIGSAPEWCQFHTVPCARHPVKVALTGVTQVCAGARYAAAIANGRLYTFGTQTYDSLGGASSATLTPLPVPALKDVTATGIACGRFHVVVSYYAPPLLPLLTSVVGPGDVALSWRAGTVTHPWHVLYRVATPGSTFVPGISLPAAAQGYTLNGLTPGVRYEVAVENLDWGTRMLWITPLP